MWSIEFYHVDDYAAPLRRVTEMANYGSLGEAHPPSLLQLPTVLEGVVWEYTEPPRPSVNRSERTLLLCDRALDTSRGVCGASTRECGLCCGRCCRAFGTFCGLCYRQCTWKLAAAAYGLATGCWIVWLYFLVFRRCANWSWDHCAPAADPLPVSFVALFSLLFGLAMIGAYYAMFRAMQCCDDTLTAWCDGIAERARQIRATRFDEP